MLTGIYSAASGIQATEVQQHVIAQNLAHINVPGYRRLTPSFETLESAWQLDADPSHGVMHQQLRADFSPGPSQQTGWALDVAVDGDGFLVIEGPQGPLYTRDGAMQIDEQGRLTTAAGFAYQGPVTIPADVSPGQIQITGEGEVLANGQSLGRLQVVRFADPHQLQLAGPTAFAAPPGLTPEPATGLPVRQGTRELANVSATTELVSMLLGMRHHEASQRALKSLSEAVEQRIQSVEG